MPITSATQVLGPGVVLAVTLVVGTLTHELSHALALRVFGVPFERSWLPDRDRSGLLRASITGGWAEIRPVTMPETFRPWQLRVAAMMPLLLATPLALVGLGVTADPLTSAPSYGTAVAIGWLACALPSPQDFALLWHAEEALVEGLPTNSP